jgi:hypothetical protein
MFLRDGPHAGQGGQRQVPEPGLERKPEAELDRRAETEGAALEGVIVPARHPEAAHRNRGLALAWIAGVAAARAVRDPRFEATVITGVVTLLAVSKMGKDDLTGAMRRISLWDAKRTARELDKELRRQRKA